MSVIQPVLLFVFHTLALIVGLRFMMRLFYVSPHAPLVPFLIRFTKPIIGVVGLFSPTIGRVETASLVVLMLIYALQIGFLYVPFSIWVDKVAIVIALSLLQSLKMLLDIVFFAVLLRALSSWITPQSNPLVEQVLVPLTHWIQAPIGRLIPPIANVDMSPLVVLLVLQIVENAVLRPVIINVASGL